MAVVSVDIPDNMVKKFKPFSIIKIETLISNYFDENDNLEFNFKKENINQEDFLSYLKLKHG